MSSNLYLVTIPVKPYIKQYLINNWGNPVVIAKSELFSKVFLKLLSKENYVPSDSPGKQLVTITISKDSFHRYGFSLFGDNLLEFQNELERRLKCDMRNYIGFMTITGSTVAEAIRLFQEKYNFPEDVWSFEAIKKDIDRNTSIKRNAQVKDFFDTMEKKVQKRIADSINVSIKDSSN